MKSRFALFAVVGVVSAFFASGCGFHGGLRRDADTQNDFQYKMDVSQVEYKGSASGTSDIGMLFCLIPFGSDPYKTAMENLQKDAKLKPNEVLVNFRDDQGFTGIAYIWCTSRLTVSADVIQLTPTNGPPPAPAAP